MDPVGFKIIALASRNDLLAVCGVNQCIVMRINKDGDISERQNVQFAGPLPSNAVPKVNIFNNRIFHFLDLLPAFASVHLADVRQNFKCKSRVLDLLHCKKQISEQKLTDFICS